jgi:hypothetical protein
VLKSLEKKSESENKSHLDNKNQNRYYINITPRHYTKNYFGGVVVEGGALFYVEI